MARGRRVEPDDARHDDARDAFLGTWVPRAIADPDSARNRAQAGYAISSAIAASIVAVGAFANIEDRSLPAQLLGATAVLCWIATAILYLQAVTAADSDAPEVPVTPDTDWLVGVLKHSRQERLRVDRAQGRATRATVLSVVFTLPALLFGFLSSVALDKDAVTLSLSSQGTAAVTKLCGRRPPAIRGVLESRTLTRDFVVIELEQGLCGDEPLTLRLPKADVLGIANE